MTPLERAKLSLDGLSIGDAFGERFFGEKEKVLSLIQKRTLPKAPWVFTDDTVMAIGILEVLEEKQTIHQDSLATIFARNYKKNPRRGYGRMAHTILQDIGSGVSWTHASREAFDGLGSYGNGGAMRVAPVGAFFAEDFAQVVEQAKRSAEVTHAHPEGQAGAVAVAVAAAWAWQNRSKKVDPFKMLETVLSYIPPGETRQGIESAVQLPLKTPILQAAETLGNGSAVSAQDTVPFCLWCAVRHLHHYKEALWNTVEGLGDRDTTCAIVGGIVSLFVGTEGIPREWMHAREPIFGWR